QRTVIDSFVAFCANCATQSHFGLACCASAFDRVPSRRSKGPVVYQHCVQLRDAIDGEFHKLWLSVQSSGSTRPRVLASSCRKTAARTCSSTSQRCRRL